MTADPTIPNVYNPQSLNRYSYVLNNPFRYTDPTGYHPEALGEVTEAFGFWQDPNSPDNWIMFWEGEYTFGNGAFTDVNGGYSGSLPDYSGVGEDFFIANDAFSGMSPFSGGLGVEASGGFADGAVTGAFVRLFGEMATAQEGGEGGYSKDRTNRTLRSKMHVADDGTITTDRITVSFSGIDEATAKAYIASAEGGWSSISLDLDLVASGGDLLIVPCTSVCSVNPIDGGAIVKSGVQPSRVYPVMDPPRVRHP